MHRLGPHLIQKSGRTAVKKTRAKKNAAAGCPGPRFGGKREGYLVSPSSAGLSERSTGLSPSQMRRIAL
jgi:hypothetical protein